MRQEETVDPIRLHEAMIYSAYLVDRYGEVYAPVFERLADEWEAYQRATVSRGRARRILDEAEADGVGTPRTGWRRRESP